MNYADFIKIQIFSPLSIRILKKMIHTIFDVFINYFIFKNNTKTNEYLSISIFIYLIVR